METVATSVSSARFWIRPEPTASARIWPRSVRGYVRIACAWGDRQRVGDTIATATTRHSMQRNKTGCRSRHPTTSSNRGALSSSQPNPATSSSPSVIRERDTEALRCQGIGAGSRSGCLRARPCTGALRLLRNRLMLPGRRGCAPGTTSAATSANDRTFRVAGARVDKAAEAGQRSPTLIGCE